MITTGFTTTRGRIIRRILNREVKDPDVFKSIIIFISEVIIVGYIVLFSVLFLYLRVEWNRIFIFLKFVDFLVACSVPPLPIAFNLIFSFTLVRLKHKNVSGTDPRKCVDGADVKNFFFDKTGTLTKPDVSIRNILKLSSESNTQAFTDITSLMLE